MVQEKPCKNDGAMLGYIGVVQGFCGNHVELYIYLYIKGCIEGGKRVILDTSRAV